MLKTDVCKQTHYIFSGTVRNIFAGFVLDRQSRGLSKGTIEYYEDEISRFCVYLDSVGVIRIEEITPEIIRRYLLELATHRNAGGVHAAFRAIRALLRWYDEEFEPDNWKNPIRKIKPPKVNHQALPGVSVDVIHQIIEACNTEYGLRDQALFLVLLDTGARAAEFIALDLGDVDLITGAVTIRHGKGDKRRTVFLGQKARRALRKYLKDRNNLKPDTPLFISREQTRFTYNGLVSLIRLRSAAAGVDRPGLHDFRRAFALAMLRNGVDLVSLSRLLGHSSVAVTQRYLAQIDSDLQVAHQKGGPVDHADW